MFIFATTLNKKKMENVYTFLSGLPEEKKNLFRPIFETIDCFYTVVYLIVKNEHVTELDKPELWEQRLEVIRQVKGKVISLLDSFDLNGRGIVADIASDYFEDFVKYRELETKLTNDEFISIVQRVSLIP